MPYRVELWDEYSQRIRWVVAEADHDRPRRVRGRDYLLRNQRFTLRNRALSSASTFPSRALPLTRRTAISRDGCRHVRRLSFPAVPQRCPGKMVEVPNPLIRLG